MLGSKGQGMKHYAKVKDTIVGILMEEGYDLLSACEESDKIIREFKDSGKHKQKIITSQHEFTLCKKETQNG